MHLCLCVHVCSINSGIIVQTLIAEGHYATDEIKARLSSMEDEHNALLENWRKRQELFSQCHELQLFLRDAEQRDAWISTKEAFLANQDLGVSLSLLPPPPPPHPTLPPVILLLLFIVILFECAIVVYFRTILTVYKLLERSTRTSESLWKLMRRKCMLWTLLLQSTWLQVTMMQLLLETEGTLLCKGCQTEVRASQYLVT